MGRFFEYMKGIFTVFIKIGGRGGDKGVDLVRVL